MGLEGHKRGCKCVGCSPATRKRGMAALKKHQVEAGGGEKKNPRRSKKRGKSEKRNPSRARELAGAAGKTAAAAIKEAGKEAVAEVKKAATAAARRACEKVPKGERKNPEGEGRKPAAGLTVPEVKAGQFIALVGRKGRRFSQALVFDSQAEAERHLQNVSATRALVVRVSSQWQ